MTISHLSEVTSPELGSACAGDEAKRRFGRRHGLSPAQVEDLCRRVGTGRAALEAALGLLQHC